MPAFWEAGREMRGVSRRGACAYVASTSPQKSVTSCDPFVQAAVSVARVCQSMAALTFTLLLDCNGFASWRAPKSRGAAPPGLQISTSDRTHAPPGGCQDAGVTRGRAQGELSLGETRLESSRPPRPAVPARRRGGAPPPAAPQARTHDAATSQAPARRAPQAWHSTKKRTLS